MLATEPHTRLRYFCSPQHTDSALYPIIGQVERAAGFAHGDEPQARLDKLDALLAQSSTSTQDAALFAEMLSLPNDGRYPALDLDPPQQRRQRTLAALIAQMQALTSSNPVLMIFEDVHWIDPTSLEALNRTVDRVKTLPALLIVSFRPEFNAPWVGQSHVTSLTLNRLGEQEAAAIIARLVGNQGLPAEVMAEIVERTDGIPLFVEEMTKAVLEAESEGAARRTVAAVPSPALAVPPSLHASLMARLDRLGPAKEVAQIGAAIGREFSHALLASVARKPEAELGSALDRLVQAGLLSRQGMPPHASYLFKHALVQDAAYGTLLREPRQRLHARIARELEERFSETAEREPEVLAYHFAEAAQVDRAVACWLEAGRRAIQRSATTEAITQLTRGIEALGGLPETLERARQELALQLALGPAQMSAGTDAAPAVEAAYLRARELALQVGETEQLFAATWGLWHHHAFSGRLATAQEDVTELLRVAEQRADTASALQAHHAAWTTFFNLPNFSACREHVECGRLLFDVEKHRSHKFLYGDHDPGVCCLSHAALVAWMLGYPDQAVKSAREAVMLAETLSHPVSVMQALLYLSFVHQFRRDTAATRESADALVALSDRQVVGPKWAVTGQIMRGWAAAIEGLANDSGNEIRSRIAHLRRLGLELRQPYLLALLAEVHLYAQKPDQGLSAIAEARQCIERTGERRWEAELHRLEGELLLLSSPQNPAEAEPHLDRALEVARLQGAKSLELRASLSLVRLWRQQRLHEARDLLAPIYGWFTEGFDTLDLKEAKALLDELAR